MPDESDSPLGAVERYYSEKVAKFGATPAGVDWNGRESQELRFEQLLRIAASGPFSLNDVGCGFGSLVDFLESRGDRFEYAGYDVSPAMIEAALKLYGARPNCTFHLSAEIAAPADYSVASGIFNVKVDRGDDAWLAYILDTLRKMDRASARGFAFNCLTKYSDAGHMRPHLYYADPGFLFDYCKRNFSRQVALLHDYGLYEFTLLVRK